VENAKNYSKNIHLEKMRKKRRRIKTMGEKHGSGSILRRNTNLGMQ
jgi:hypothetical protein